MGVTPEHEAALELAARGFRVFPGCLKDGRMQPAVKAFYDTASCDPTQINEWWERWPDAWVAVATGPTNDLVVIDQDVKTAGINGIEAWRAKWPAEYEFRGPQMRSISGGLHDWFRYTDWERAKISNSASAVAPGVDVRAWHGFVWVPPSGREWLTAPDPLRIPELPAWAFDLVKPAQGPRASTRSAHDETIAQLRQSLPTWVEGDGRNEKMNRLAGDNARRVPRGDYDTYEKMCLADNATMKEPLEEEELRRLMADPWEKQQAKPERDESLPVTWTDAEVGEVFGRTIEGRWLFCKALGGWMQWDGMRWLRDPGEAVYEEFRTWVLSLATRMFADPLVSDAAIRAAAKYRERNKIDSAVTIARRLPWVAAQVGDFDQHPYLLNCTNGVVDLRTGELQGHSPALRITKITGGPYVAGSTHPDVTAALDAVSDEVRPWLQRLLGSSMVGEVRDDIVAVLDGPGSNGKSSILVAMDAACGEYASPVSARLLVSKSAYDEHPTLIADLAGRRLVYVEETPEGGSLKMEQLKSLSGGGKLKARFIGKDQFEFEPTFQLVIATNHRPAVNASDYAAWRRLALVPFPKTFKKAHEAKPGDLVMDPLMRPRLKEEAQRVAMLAWVIEGARLWHEQSLGTCAPVEQATAMWRNTEDIIVAWWDQTVEEDIASDSYVAGGVLYTSYVDWCSRAGRQASSLKEFMKRFVDHERFATASIEKRIVHKQARYYGIKLQSIEARMGGQS